MSAKDPVTFTSDFKRFFFRGLGVLLPSVLTLWLLVHAYLFVERQVAEPINRAIRQGVLWVIPRTVPENRLPGWFVVSSDEVRQYRSALEAQGTPTSRALSNRPEPEIRAVIRAESLRRYWDAHWYFRFIGLVVAIILIYLAGLLLGGLLGRSIYEALERFLTRIPVFKQVYPHVKQLVDLVLGERSMAFKRVVFIEYPRKGVYTLAFVTGSGIRGAANVAGGEVITVFVPSTPTPFTGFTITVRKDEAIEVPITIDEAIRFVLTGGVLTPASLPAGQGLTLPPSSAPLAAATAPTPADAPAPGSPPPRVPVGTAPQSPPAGPPGG